MSVRFIHTADWHLGQLFYQHTRYKEHEIFLKRLLSYIEFHQPHALLIAGDIFDVINPPAQAQKQFYQFLADANQCAKHMQILMIAGNHDSGYRIEQVNPLLEKYHAKAVGVLNWIKSDNEEKLDFTNLIIPIYNEWKTIVAWCIALPFLRSAEVTGHDITDRDTLKANIKIYQLLLQEAARRCQPHQVIILMTHAHIQGATESTDSERPIIIGYEEAISVEHFAKIADYVALGHLHKPQKVKYEHIRYSGSPIPMSFSEVHYKHQVMLVDINKQTTPSLTLTPLFIPHSVKLVPIRCHLNDLFTEIKKLPQEDIKDPYLRHFVDIEYTSQDVAPPDLRKKIEQLLPETCYRLVRLARKANVQTSLSLSSEQNIKLLEPKPQDLFKQMWTIKYQDLSQYTEQLQQDFMWLEQQAYEQSE